MTMITQDPPLDKAQGAPSGACINYSYYRHDESRSARSTGEEVIPTRSLHDPLRWTRAYVNLTTNYLPGPAPVGCRDCFCYWRDKSAVDGKFLLRDPRQTLLEKKNFLGRILRHILGIYGYGPRFPFTHRRMVFIHPHNHPTQSTSIFCVRPIYDFFIRKLPICTHIL